MSDVTQAPPAEDRGTRAVDPPVQNAEADAEIARREAGEPAPIGPEEQAHINVVEDIISEGIEVAGGPVVEAQAPAKATTATKATSTTTKQA